MEARSVRPGTSSTINFPPDAGELVFGFVLGGSATVDYREGFTVGPSDAFVIPPDEPWRLSSMSADFGLLHITTAQLD